MSDTVNPWGERARESPCDFEDLYRAEYPRLARTLFLLTLDRGEAEEMAQEAMARLYERWEAVRTMGSPAGYLYRIALNLNRRRLRRVARALRPVDGSPAQDDPAETAERRLAVRAALRSLSREQREALVLVEWVGLDAAGAGALLGISAESVRSRVRRAKVRLNERFGRSEGA